jgi:hypothetical protein
MSGAVEASGSNRSVEQAKETFVLDLCQRNCSDLHHRRRKECEVRFKASGTALPLLGSIKVMSTNHCFAWLRPCYTSHFETNPLPAPHLLCIPQVSLLHSHRAIYGWRARFIHSLKQSHKPLSPALCPPAFTALHLTCCSCQDSCTPPAVLYTP